ncbi:MAG: thiamine phosphate synthase [Rhodospirillales bacterium]|nr:thiamine phosphate synthase [Rhodospirillales bacterium]
MSARPDPSCQLYLVTPPRIDPAAFASPLAAALDAGPVAAVQLRLKDADDDTIRAACDRLRPLVQARDVAFILNDRPDLAAAFGCDGVHIGQNDADYPSARAAVGSGAIVGVTCHASRHLAMVAAEAGADYVAFGTFYPTTTKAAMYRADIDLLSWWSAVMTVPCVAIGGITVDNASPLAAAGADFLAVCGGVWAHPEGPAAAVRAFARLFEAAGAD